MTHRVFTCGLVAGLLGFAAGAGAQTSGTINTGAAKTPASAINGSVPNSEKRAGSLTSKLPDLRLEKVTFAEAVDFLRDATNANIHVNWRALEAEGVSKDTLVSIRARNVSVRTALKLILQDAAPGNMVSYYQDEGIIEITTKQLADSQLVTRVYNVQDLLVDVPDFTQVQSIQMQSSQRGTVQGAGGGGGGNTSSGNANILGQSDSNVGTSGRNGGQASTYDRADDLVSIIKQTIQPEIWRDNGGTATINYFNGHLIVTAPRSVHEALAGHVE